MGLADKSLMLKICFILVIVTLIIHVLAFFIPYWYQVDVLGADFHGGMIQGCVGSTCNKISSAPDWFEGARAMEILGLICLIAALVVLIIVMFFKDMKLLKIVNLILLFAACFFIIVGVIIYGAKASGVLDEYHAAFGLCIVAGIFALVCAILALLDLMGKGK